MLLVQTVIIVYHQGLRPRLVGTSSTVDGPWRGEEEGTWLLENVSGGFDHNIIIHNIDCWRRTRILKPLTTLSINQ